MVCSKSEMYYAIYIYIHVHCTIIIIKVYNKQRAHAYAMHITLRHSTQVTITLKVALKKGQAGQENTGNRDGFEASKHHSSTHSVDLLLLIFTYFYHKSFSSLLNCLLQLCEKATSDS